MRCDSVLRYIINRTGKSMRAISIDMGRADTWAKNSSRAGRVPQLDTVVGLADLAGLDVALVDRETGKVVATVDVPCREDSV